MKRVMNILYSVLFLFTVTVSVNAAEGRGVKVIDVSKESKTVPTAPDIPKPSNTNNDLLKTILENATILVHQIKNNMVNAEQRKTALAEITRAENAFSKNAKTQDLALLKNIDLKVKQQTDIIKQESKTFVAHHKARGKQVKKYSPEVAEKALVALASLVKSAAEETSEAFVTKTRQALELVQIDVERIRKDANEAINSASIKVAKGEMTPVQAAKVIGEQKNIIVKAERYLAQMKERSKETVAQSDVQSGYLSQFATKVYNAGAYALSPLRAGYDKTDEEKEVARAVIVELKEQIKKQTELFNQAKRNPRLTQEQLAEMTDLYNATIQELNAAIHDQQLITGEAMSTARKLFWATVGVAGVAGAAYLGYKGYQNQQNQLLDTMMLQQEELQLQRDLQSPVQNESPLSDPNVPIAPTLPSVQEPISNILPVVDVDPVADVGLSPEQQAEEDPKVFDRMEADRAAQQKELEVVSPKEEEKGDMNLPTQETIIEEKLDTSGGDNQGELEDKSVLEQQPSPAIGENETEQESSLDTNDGAIGDRIENDEWVLDENKNPKKKSNLGEK